MLRGSTAATGELHDLAAANVALAQGAIARNRDVVVGVTDRVSAEIVSGLSEGERVLAGNEVASAPRGGRGFGAGRCPADACRGGGASVETGDH